jgi:glucose/arabinose dehydrogenase
MTSRIIVLAFAAVTLASACSSGSGPQSAGTSKAVTSRAAVTSGAAVTGSAASAVPAPALTRIRLVVPASEDAAPFNKRRMLLMPRGWTAKVWARVPDARMEAWTPGGDLLVSEPGLGKIDELVPDRSGTARPRTLLSGLTEPQGMAFAKFAGHWVLYVAESDEIDRYPWGTSGIDGARTIVAGNLPDTDPTGDDVHRVKDLVIARNGTIYFNVGSSSNADPDDLTMKPPRAVIMSVRPNGTHLTVVERGVRNGEGLALAPDGVVWTAVNNRDNIPYPFHRPYGGHRDAFGLVIQSYVNNHPPDEVVPVIAGRNLGWPYCNPDQDENDPPGSLANVPFVPDALTNPGDRHLDCATLPRLTIGLPAHTAPLGMSFLEGTTIPAPWSGGAVIGAHGSWNRVPPRSPAVLWLAWNSKLRTLAPAVTLVSGFQLANGKRWGRPVDVVPGPGGALYVSDDTAGAIYRLVPAR